MPTDHELAQNVRDAAAAFNAALRAANDADLTVNWSARDPRGGQRPLAVHQPPHVPREGMEEHDTQYPDVLEVQGVIVSQVL